MNINRHNYEEYILEYLEGTLNPKTQAELEAFLANNPDVADEVSALAAGMPILAADTDVVFARKNELKKPENPKTVAFWGNNRGRFFVLSLAAAFILFALGWWVITNINTLETQSGTVPVAQQASAPAAPTTASVEVLPVGSGNIDPATSGTPVMAAATKPLQSGLGTRKQSTAHTTSTFPVYDQLSGSQKQRSQNVASIQTANLPMPAVAPSEQTLTKMVVAPQILSKPANAVIIGQAPRPVLALQQVGRIAATKEPELLAQENTTQSKALRAIGKILFSKKPNRRLPSEETGSESMIAQLTNSIVPEAYRETTEPIDASISFSLAVSPGTHRILKDLLNR